jgi:hypothetical protein
MPALLYSTRHTYRWTSTFECDHMTAPLEVPRLTPVESQEILQDGKQVQSAVRIRPPSIHSDSTLNHTLSIIGPTQPARSSSASSQPHKLASSTPRNVFEQVPSWPLSSMIRKVRTYVPVSSFLSLSLSPSPLFFCLFHPYTPLPLLESAYHVVGALILLYLSSFWKGECCACVRA